MLDCISVGRMAVKLEIDKLDAAQKEGRAPWTDVVHEFKDCVWYNDGYPVTEGHSLIVPREATQQNLLRCFDLALKIGNDNVQQGIITGYNIGINIFIKFKKRIIVVRL